MVSDLTGKHFHMEVTGIVQGVGFRPYVYRLARELNLAGWVCNTPAGVLLEIEGEEHACRAFANRLPLEAPPAAQVEHVTSWELSPIGMQKFIIRESTEGTRQTLVSPDLAICQDCLQELNDPHNRRYRYPFLNCTNCGPRFTIIENLPYDRPLTTMKSFSMCGDCQAEYLNPTDRRFHAQPTACAVCGPQLAFLDAAGQILAGDPLALAQKALQQGEILAVKGLGGYHLVCDAMNGEAVAKLRQRKYRWDKPFALMMPDLLTVRNYCELTDQEVDLLESVQRPIVLLRKKAAAENLAPEIAPGTKRLGVMLPYTPLHVLLLAGWQALVMTSANRAEEPIVYQDRDLIPRLAGIADGYLTHNRPIFRYCDDSVVVLAAEAPRLLRRSRGYAPAPLVLPACREAILALGGEQKNTFCLTRPTNAFISQHIGDLDDLQTFTAYQQEISDYREMFDITPQLLAYDLHPEYHANQLLDSWDVAAMGVQHHHAHLAAVLAEYQVADQAIGLIYDGTGYGLDGHLWGGEVLVGDCTDFQRLAHLRYLPLPGGAQAIREPWRQALAALKEAEGETALAEPFWNWPENWHIVQQSIAQGINTPLASGMGRLFDAVAALAGLGRFASYEGQAAILLEQALDDAAAGSYHFAIQQLSTGWELDWRPVIKAVAADCQSGQEPGVIAARFHRAVVEMNVEIVQYVAHKTGLTKVALSGGCWQNIWLLEATQTALDKAGFTVLIPSRVPLNDGGLAYGQAAIAAARLRLGLQKI